MWNWRELPVREGVLTKVEQIEAPGPEPPEPAHASQLCHPDILSILDFTVCADRETLHAPTRAKIAITSQLLFSFFNIYSLQGNFLDWVLACFSDHSLPVAARVVRASWRLPTHLLCLNLFPPLRAITSLI